MSIRDHKDLDVWQESIKLVKSTYQVTQQFPDHELYSLVNQMRRAAVSVPSNIAEGYTRASTKEYLRHINIAYSSLAELETQYIIAAELGYIDQSAFQKMIAKLQPVSRMLNGLSKSLRQKSIKTPTPEPRTLTPFGDL